MADLDPLVDALRERRLDLGISQKVLAARSGVGQATLSDSERGRTSPILATVHQWARTLRCDVVLKPWGDT